MFLRYLSNRDPSEVMLVKACLEKIDFFIKDKFGEKYSIVIKAILQGFDAIKDGDFSDQEMLDEFIRIIKLKTNENINLPLTDEENKAIEDVAQMTLNSISDRKKINIAFKLLSKN